MLFTVLLCPIQLPLATCQLPVVGHICVWEQNKSKDVINLREKRESVWKMGCGNSASRNLIERIDEEEGKVTVNFKGGKVSNQNQSRPD